MNPFKTPEEAKAAIESDFERACFERAWLEFVKHHGLDKFLDTEKKHNFDILASCKMTFRTGYLSGIKFITGVVIGQMTSNPPTEPPK